MLMHRKNPIATGGSNVTPSQEEYTKTHRSPYVYGPCTVVCEYCKKDFTVRHSRLGKAKYCSRNCHSKARTSLFPAFVCRKCGKEKSPEMFPKDQSKYPRERDTVCKECRNKRAKKYYYATPKKSEYSVRSGAKKRGIEYSLTFDEFMAYWNKPCVYCGAEIKNIGVDRVNNEKGYVSGNVVSCCRACNVMKHTMTLQEWADKCFLIMKVLGSDFGINVSGGDKND